MRIWLLFYESFVWLSTHLVCLPSPVLVQWDPRGSRFYLATEREEREMIKHRTSE